MTKLYGYAIGVLIALLGITGVGLYLSVSANGAVRAELKRSEDAREQAEAARKRTEGILAGVRAEKAATARSDATRAEAVSRAVEAHKSWGEQSVPADLQEALAGALTP